jgi:hypothetical protein
MSEKNDPARNRTSGGEAHDKDPLVRDESAQQPGISTISPSKNDEANQHVTSSAMDGGELTNFDVDQSADPTFDQVDRSKDL